jgi:hypothetical protein
MQTDDTTPSEEKASVLNEQAVKLLTGFYATTIHGVVNLIVDDAANHAYAGHFRVERIILLPEDRGSIKAWLGVTQSPTTPHSLLVRCGAGLMLPGHRGTTHPMRHLRGAVVLALTEAALPISDPRMDARTGNMLELTYNLTQHRPEK